MQGMGLAADHGYDMLGSAFSSNGSWRGANLFSREVLDLSGWWHIWYDEAADWRNEAPLLPGTRLLDIPRRSPSAGWQGMEHGLESLQVPGTWSLSRPGYHGVAWQWRPLFIPSDWREHVVKLHFGAVRLRAEVYLDQELVGYDLEGYTPFEIDVTNKVRPGRQQELALRITNPGGSTGSGDDIPSQWAGLPLPDGHDIGGIWGDVSISATAPTHIAAILAMPDPRLTSVIVRVDVVRHHRAEDDHAQGMVRLLARIYDGEGNLACECTKPQLKLRPGRSVVDVGMEIPNPKSWTPEAPHLYRAEVTLAGDGFTDTMTVPWALRLLDVRGPWLFLNGERTFLRSAASWGWYPDNLAFPSVKLAEQEVQVARSLGLNALIMRGRPATPALLDAADRLGLMIGQGVGRFPCTEPTKLSPGAQAFGAQLSLTRARRLARRDGNHPSLVCWDLTDDGTDEGHADVIREQDPTRLVAWAAGGGRNMACNPYDRGRVVFYDPRRVRGTLPVWRDSLAAELLALHAPEAGMPLVDGHAACFAGLPDMPGLVRRYGDRVLPGSDAEQAGKWLDALEQDPMVLGMGRTFPDVNSLCRAAREPQTYAICRTIEKYRLNPNCSGLTLDGWSSSPMSGNGGMVDMFRRLQVDASRIAQANAPLAIALDGLPSQMRAREAYRVDLWALNEKGAQHGLNLEWQLGHPDGRTLERGGWPVALAGTCWQERIGQVELRAQAMVRSDMGRWTFRVALKQGDRTLVAVEHHAWVLDDPPAWPSGLQILDVAGCLGSLGQPGGEPWRPYRSESAVRSLLLVSWDDEGELRDVLLRAQQRPGRVACLLPSHGPGRDRTAEILGTLLKADRLRLDPLQSGRFAGLVYSHAHALLDGVAEQGLWTHLQADLFPSYVARSLPGDSLVGGCTFVKEGAVAVPHLGTALSIIPWGCSELLFCTLPVVQGYQNHLLSAGHLMHNITCWLVQGR